MIRTLLFTLALFIGCFAKAQINIQERLEQKAKERLERKVDKTMDKGFDKAEEGVDKGAKEATKGKKKDTGESASEHDQETEPETGSPAPATPPGKATSAPSAPTFKAYSKFDLVPGEQIVAFEDFGQDAIGDFPARWNTNSSGEVVTLEGYEGRWFQINGDGYFYPEFLDVLPENFTLEFDAVVGQEFNYYSRFIDLYFVSATNSNLLRPDQKGRVEVSIHPYVTTGKGNTGVEVHDLEGKNIINNSREQQQIVVGGVAPRAHVAVWRQKGRLRVYLNEEKVWDLPRAFQPGIDYRFVIQGGAKDGNPYIGDLRVAVGAPDTRNKLITEGKLVTRGILFDSGSDRIKPESYGTLKDIATVLAENPAVRVNIIGHTDSDGDETKNLELSKRRAAAVKEALSKEFAIDAKRMETDGKGEGQPAGPNDSPQGKANNRRVEFVKL
jgi:outer membrane protein OmpA-like peptidoglycan-associated protein